jgi:hypothetical protein
MGPHTTPGMSCEPGKGEGHHAGARLSSAGGALPPALQVGDVHTWDVCEHDPAHCGVHNPCRPHLSHATHAPSHMQGRVRRGGMQKVGPAGVVHPTVRRVVLTPLPQGLPGRLR